MRKLRATTALVGLLLLPLISLASPQKKTMLTVGGYAGATTLANFPVLVRLSAARVDGFDPNNCAANGADVWFASDAAGANPIPHEIERWDDTGESAIWVRVPELAASSPQPTTFYMFWKDDAPPANETTNVWSGADYRAVWHMNEASTTQRDSTATGLAATLPSSATVSTGAGKAGLALKVNDTITAQDFFLEANGGVSPTAYSVSSWVYGSGMANWTEYRPIAKGGDAYGSWHATYNRGGAYWTCIAYRNKYFREIPWPNIASGWGLMTLTYDGTNVRLYANGSLIATHERTLQSTAADFTLSAPGWYDETRVRNATSSDDWVKAEYDSVTDADFVTASALAPNYIRVTGSTPLANERGMEYGVHDGLEAGESYTFEAPEYGTNVAATVAYRCTGWTLTLTNGTVVSSTAESPRRCTVEFAAGMEKATLAWQWTVIEYKLDMLVSGQGSVDVPSQFLPVNSSVTITATPAAGWKFWRLTGSGFKDYDAYRTNFTVIVSGPCAITANFYDPATTPQVVRYVTPSGAGTKDGTSWANACATIQTAYEKVAANPSGGELWIRYGKYELPTPIVNGSYTNCTIVVRPNISLRGGFAGTETSADEADPAANPTVLHVSDYHLQNAPNWSNGDPKWTTDSTGLMWFNEPPSKGDTTLYETTQAYARHDAFQSLYGVDDFGKIEFHGLTFTMFWASAVCISTTGNHNPIAFRKCRFLDMGWLLRNSVSVIDVTGIGADIRDCEFLVVQNPFSIKTLSDASPRRSAVVENCRFDTSLSSVTWYTASGGIAAQGNVSLTVRNCRFDRNLGNAWASGALTWNALGDLLVEDTVFQRGYSYAPYYGGALCLLWKGASAGSFTLRRCRFERCCSDASGQAGWGQGAAIGVWGDLNGGVLRGLVEDTAFVGNFTGGASVNAAASCVCFGQNCGKQDGYCAFTFLNCLFETNSAIHKTNGRAGTVVGCSSTQSPRPVFVNCVFKDNVCGKLDAATKLVCDSEFGREGSPNFAFVNSIFENANAEMYPWSAADCDRFCFANCASDKSVAYGDGSADSYRCQPLDLGADARLEPAPVTNGTVVARRVEPASRYRAKGRPVWLGTDNEPYLYDAAGDAAKPWRPCRKYGARLTDAEAAAIAVSLAAQPIPDAFAAPRRKAKCALGNLNPRPIGAALRLR